MAGEQDLVVETVRDILNGFEPFVLTAERRWDAGLWGALAESGLTGVGLPEEAGGSGGELADAVAIVRTLAAGAAAVPVAEQLLVAGPALVAADLTPAPAGLDGSLLALIDASGLQATDAFNLAGEPRGSLVLDDVPAAGALLTAAQADELRARFALARSVQLAAALERVLAWTVQYAGERHQFGRPLGKFQAIQMELAEMAGEVTAVTALTDAAVQALDHGSADFVLAAAAAKVRAGAAVEVVARLAHQVHGAIGFTQEHKLHHLTRRCWAWRDEAGSDLVWSRVLGAGLLAGGPDGLWPALTRVV